MTQLLMPQATAVWLVDNTSLSFAQIADFCSMHPLEIQAVADGEVAVNIVGQDPVTGGQLDAEEVARCEADPDARLKIRLCEDLPQPKQTRTRYTPVSKRQDKPDAIEFLVRRFPQLSDAPDHPADRHHQTDDHGRARPIPTRTAPISSPRTRCCSVYVAVTNSPRRSTRPTPR